MPARSVPSPDGYTLRGLAPPELARRPIAERRLFWGWVVELGLKAKDRDLAKGLDKDGRPLRPISARTRKYRKSAMTPTGKGSPAAPPLMPGYQLSRTRSLLTGRAEGDRAEFWWRFDPFTGASWAKVLEYQKDQGRDVFGLSAAAVRRVMAGAVARWQKFTRGQSVPEPRVPTVPQAPARIERVGSMPTAYTTFGIGQASPAALKPGTFSGLRTHAELIQHLRTPAKVRIPGRPAGRYNVVLRHVWGSPGRPPASAAPAMPRPRTGTPMTAAQRVAMAPRPAPAPMPLTLAQFAAEALAAARRCVPWSGSNKVWIVDAYDQFRRVHPEYSLERFKARLLEANAARLLTLSRADMPNALTAEERAKDKASSTRLGPAEFNFIRV